MDSTLTSLNIRASDRTRREFRARFVIGYLVSYTIDVVLLGLFAAAGTIPFWIPIAYYATGLTVGAAFAAFMLFGISERYKDPYFTFWQTSVSGACMLVFLAFAPEVGFLFLCTLFIVFGFGSLRMSWRDALVSFGLIALGAGAVMYHTSGIMPLPHSTPLEKLLVWMAFILILARLIVLGLVGNRLRTRVVKAYRQLKVSSIELENRTSELIEAKAAADAANEAVLEYERKRAEQAVLESEERFRQLAETMADAVLVGQDGRNVYANLAAARLLGAAAPEEIVGTDIFAIIEPAGHEQTRLKMQRVLAGEKLSYFEDRFVRFDGSVVLVEIAASPLAWRGRPGLQVVVRDITKRKQAEQALRASLVEKEVMMREIHHRVKNNLQMMSALLELQSGYVKDEQALAYFKDSQQRIQSMAMIHAQLYQTGSLAQIDFAAYLQSLVDHLRGQFGEQCKQVNIRVDAQACVLPVDTAIPLGLVVTELVTNAMKHAFPPVRSGELRIVLQVNENGSIVLEVTDDGVGVSAESDPQGVKGFGMELVALMVEKQLHGKLSVESNHGTRVVCQIGVQS